LLQVVETVVEYQQDQGQQDSDDQPGGL